MPTDKPAAVASGGQHQANVSDEQDDMWELPDVMFGMTTLQPTIRCTGHLDPHARGTADGAKGKGEVQHVEHVSGDRIADVDGTAGGGCNAALWKQSRSGEWYLEGLQGIV